MKNLFSCVLVCCIRHCIRCTPNEPGLHLHLRSQRIKAIHHLMHTQRARAPPTSPSTKYKGHDQGLGSEKFTKTLIETVTGLITPTPPSCEVYHTPHVQPTTSLRRGPFHPHVKFTAPFLWDLPYPSRETHHTQYVESTPPLGSWHLFFSPAGFPLLSVGYV